ncbi:winged helix-turn-helix transcriptional regulator [Catenibacterium sp.]|uniref:winged helix-turn-helix transcriptional regulator n=1 Tax=Catenibacterium sp. TaxID=2049022 RepID=UPI003AB8627D
MKKKKELPACPVATSVSLIGDKWKLLIIRNLKSRTLRFNELQRDLDGISQKVITKSLRQMIDDGLVYRNDYHENPPRVDYGLTDLGNEMMPIIDALADFGNYYKTIVE